ncbi:hypothetical protein [Microcoleus sp. Pol12B4]|uniref:hypothetical protein n=1 Tax=Microcoleus sp. Pol12B4 TaxID=3055395 RepID=UPI002FD4F832
MWQTTEPIELPLKALREDKLNTAERFVVTRPCCREGRIHEYKPVSKVDSDQIRATT